MKQISSILFLIICTYANIGAQPGFEGIVIEKYYLADLNDSSTPFFPVPVDAVTYRVYVDMAPQWELQALFGSTNGSSGEIDTLVIRSTQPFFNNEDRGRIFGYSIPTNNIDENTVLLDSWFSTGRSSSLTVGVVKPEDTNGAIPAFPNLNGLLQNNDPTAGIPINSSDGNISSMSTATWSLIGINPEDFLIFDDTNLSGNELIISNGALTSFTTPLQGPNATNKVLIGQFTTAGEFSGQLNLQIRNTITGEIQQWIAETPDIGQYTSPDLSWQANQPPTVHISSPIDGAYYLSGQTVFVTAQAADIDSAILQVEFFFNGASLGIDDTTPYEGSFIAATNGEITAVATGDFGVQTTSAPVYITVNPYGVDNVEQFCYIEKVCIPIIVFGAGITDVIGYVITLTFDNTKIIPTGIIRKTDDLLDPDLFSTDFNIDLLQQQMQIAVYLDGLAPGGTSFSGIGELICVEFVKRPAFGAIDSTVLSIVSLSELSAGGDTEVFDSIPSGVFLTKRNTAFLGSLAFWADNSPMKYDSSNTSNYLITNIAGANESCDLFVTDAIHPNLEGAFTHDLNYGNYLVIERDIAGTTDVQEVINGFDAFLVRKLLMEDQAFIPSIYQMMAMDVNMDGVISAGDVSQINQRSMLSFGEFKQSWNYNGDGTLMADSMASKDWLFLNHNAVLFNPAYSRSTTYPEDNGIGYSKHRVPQIPSCTWTEIDNQPGVCPKTGYETYHGILVGDVNGNYRLIANDGVLK